MGRATKPLQARKRWTGGEIDADPFMLPQRITIRANETMHRLFGFIRYAVIHSDAVKATDSSPILGPFIWDEPMSAYRGVALRVAWRDAKGAKPVILVQLVHATDERHSVVVHASFDGADVAARWRSWGRTLALPLLLEDREGELQAAERRLGSLRIDTPQPHAGANPLSARRPMAFGVTGRPRHWPQRLTAGARPPAY
ncbi:MAG: DUF6101 family protein [Parvibaculum sp.]|uniref:DUF6101 family protein n=1 Tax=Parvibaculum sp. TaxID=2024848 RepID=UPI0025EE12F6|nr:DUF6101 family protein [Parvibaculum sp.]MCE9648668.1 DUF6101 family protein [Parvibaculum sp.]